MATNVKIDQGFAFDGDAIVQGGIGNYFYLINKEDFDSNQVLTFDVTTNEITALTLASTTQGYKFESSKGSAQIIPSATGRGASAIDGFNHSLDVILVESTQLSQDNAKKMRFQKVVAIVPLVDGRFKLYGRRVGLRIEPGSWEEMPGDADTGGSYHFILVTPENDPPEIDPPHYIASDFDITSLDTPAV